MDNMTRVKKLRHECKEKTGYDNPFPVAWSVNFFSEWEKVTAMVKQEAEKRGVDLNNIWIVRR